MTAVTKRMITDDSFIVEFAGVGEVRRSSTVVDKGLLKGLLALSKCRLSDKVIK